MDITIKHKSILRIAAERVLENLYTGNILFLSKPEPLIKHPETKMKSGYTLANHHHPEIIQVFRGRSRLKLSDNTINIRPDQLVFISPGTMHGEMYYKTSIPYMLLWIIIYPSGIDFFISEYNNKTFSVRPERFLYNFPISKSLWNIATANTLSTDILTRAKLQEYLLHACCELAERSGDHEIMPDYHQKLVKQIQAYIDLHYAEPITVNDLSQIVRCSSNHLNTLFRQYLGMPIHQYILQKRLREAKYSLENSSCSVKEIAYRFGFTDPLYFSRLFRKYFSIPPSKV
jgi:AraC-like DNA-binding protein